MHSQSPALPPLPPFLICNSKHLFYILQRFLFLNKAFTKKKLSQLGEQSAVCLNRATVPLEMTCAAEHRTDKTRTVLQHLANLASTYFQRFLFAESCKKKMFCLHVHTHIWSSEMITLHRREHEKNESAMWGEGGWRWYGTFRFLTATAGSVRKLWRTLISIPASFTLSSRSSRVCKSHTHTQTKPKINNYHQSKSTDKRRRGLWSLGRWW